MKILHTVVILLVYYNSLNAQSVSLTSNVAYDYLQNERAKASAILNNIVKPPIDSLNKAEKILEEALKYYFREDVQTLAKADKYLFARESDINFDLIVIKLKKGENQQAASLLIKNLNEDGGEVYYGWIKNEPTFTNIRNLPEIANIIAKIQANGRVFDGTALNTPYRLNISEAEKLAGLSKFWSEAKYNFAYFENVPNLNWDSLYLAYIPKIQQTKSTIEYFKLIQAFCASLKDGHTNVWASADTLADLVSRYPPITTSLVEDKVLITKILSDSLEKVGFRVGMEIVSIDKIPVKKYAELYVKPYQNSSTPQYLDYRTYNRSLFRGSKNKVVSLELRTADGKVITKKVAYGGYNKIKQTPSFEYRILPNNIAYFAINEFETNAARKKFISIIDSIANTKALILDIRQNGGGDTDFRILSYLTDKSIAVGKQFVSKYVPTYRARGQSVVWQEELTDPQLPNKTHIYTKPVVLLISPQTFSAAEDFAVAFDSMKRGTMIGEATGGSTGQPLSFELPGGLMGRVCTKRDYYPDGKVFVGVGIQPNLIVRSTIVDIRTGKDSVLEAAMLYLTSQR